MLVEQDLRVEHGEVGRQRAEPLREGALQDEAPASLPLGAKD